MPVYDLYGLQSTGLVERDWPPATDTAYHGRAMGYHLRQGGHNLLAADWRLFMDFADLNFPASPGTVVVEVSDPPLGKSTDPHAMLPLSTASNGTLCNLQANAVGDYVTYAIPDLRAGVTYDVAVRARKTSDARIFKIYVQDQLFGSGSQRGAASGYDRYTAAHSWRICRGSPTRRSLRARTTCNSGSAAAIRANMTRLLSGQH